MMKIDTVWYRFIIFFLTLTLTLAIFPEAKATHIRAGEITAKSDTALVNPNPLKYYFKLVTYVVTSQQIPDAQGTLFFGDGGSQTVNKEPEQILPNNITRRVFYFSHVYPAAGTYTVLYNEQNRNSSIVNIDLPSMNSFLITTTVTITPQIGINRSPQFSVPPLDVAALGQIFIHFPGAYDLDQDSLSYRLVTPQRNSGTINNPQGSPVFNYLLPNNSKFGGAAITDPVTGANAGDPPRFDLNPVTGEIRWNSPGSIGEYNISFVVEEWKTIPGRRAVKIGEVTRDMQIKVESTPNLRPTLRIPPDTCVIAGTFLRTFINGSDPNSDPMTFNAYSGIIPPAQFIQTTNETARFQWTPQCTDISEHPYQVIFKVTDNPPGQAPDLVDLKAWNIKVVGPKPTNLTATLQPGKQMLLTWDPYLVNGCANAEKIHIYRRVNRANFIPDNCETGVPSGTGYVKIGEVAASINTFTDTNNGQGLKAGTNYCYIIYASFPAPKNGESLASLEACAEVPVLTSLLTNVDVTETSRTTGKIEVKWTRPLKGVNNVTGPVEYRLFRAFGLSGTQAYTQIFSSGDLNDTVFMDNNLNTLDSTYHYKLEFYENTPIGLQLLEPGDVASSVRLEAQSVGLNMQLNWRYEVPWDNSQRKHIIYRQVNGAFVPIDSVIATATSGTYIDKGTFNNQPLEFGKNYCYYIETVGVFSLSKLPPVVFNRSQEFCQTLRDTIPPCAPILSLALLNCDSLQNSPLNPPFQNKLNWQPATGNGCGNDVASYNVYVRQTDDAPFEFVTNTTDLSFVHRNLPIPTGCYAVTAIDSSGNESAQSNIVCQQVCFFLELPNIISPNNDNRNDTFRPKQTAFIRSVKFTVYNRWGVKVYDKTTGPGIDWGGVNDNGNRVPDGVYYYLADIEFAGPDPATSRRTFKGWVEVVQ